MKKENNFKSVEAQRFILAVQALIDQKLANSFSEIAKSVGFSSQDFTDIKSGKKDLPRKFLDSIAGKYPISKSFILTGQENSEEKLSRKENNIPGSNAVIIGEIQNPEDESSFIDIGNGQFIMVVPVVPIRAQAGYIQNYHDEKYIEENFTQKHSFAVSRVYRGRYMAFIIDGDSMDDGTSNAIIEGSTVTGREIQKTHWRNKFHIHRYKDYVIVHRDGIFTKRITQHDTENGIITCNSLNPNKELYGDFDLNLDDCLQIFNIVNVTQPR